MTEIDNYLNERLSHVNTDAVEAICHPQDDTFTLITSTNNDAWIKASCDSLIEIKQ